MYRVYAILPKPLFCWCTPHSYIVNRSVEVSMTLPLNIDNIKPMRAIHKQDKLGGGGGCGQDSYQLLDDWAHLVCVVSQGNANPEPDYLTVSKHVMSTLYSIVTDWHMRAAHQLTEDHLF